MANPAGWSDDDEPPSSASLPAFNTVAEPKTLHVSRTSTAERGSADTQTTNLMRSISDGVVRQRRGRLEKSPMMTASPLVFGRSLRQSSAVEEEPSNWRPTTGWITLPEKAAPLLGGTKPLQPSASNLRDVDEEEDGAGGASQAVLFGMINAIILIPVMIGFAAIIFRHPVFQPHMPVLIKLVMFAAVRNHRESNAAYVLKDNADPACSLDRRSTRPPSH